MPSSICCTNCRTKYSLLNREAGCSSCALSFCKKCLGYRAVIPSLSDLPMIVCYNCYQKIENAKVKPMQATITHVPLPSSSQNSSAKNWWGEGLPPPSFRSTYGNPTTSTSSALRPTPPTKPQSNFPIADLEERRRKLRENLTPPTSDPLTIEEIEERLAKLRGCDVELIRNPRNWFSSSENPEMNANNPRDLMKMAEDRARLEEKDEEIEKQDFEELDARRKKIFENPESSDKNEESSIRESMISGVSEFSEATKEEMNEINSLLNDAEKRVSESKKQEDLDAAELRTIMKSTRQKSLDAMQWNDKITKEIGGFWDRQNEKQAKDGEEEDDEKSLDEETFKKILHEAENSEDVPPPATKTTTSSASSPKKKGFFEKLFRKDSKN